MKNAAGEVAVLLSPNYGAGWSSWASDVHREFLTMDDTLVEMALRGAKRDEVGEYLGSVAIDTYLGGWEDVEVRWVSPGTAFIIEDYDGAECIWTAADLWLST